MAFLAKHCLQCVHVLILDTHLTSRQSSDGEACWLACIPRDYHKTARLYFHSKSRFACIILIIVLLTMFSVFAVALWPYELYAYAASFANGAVDLTGCPCVLQAWWHATL